MKFQSILLIFATLILSQGLQAQYTISGKVMNSNNEKLVGASVFILDQNLATSTDEWGNYTIEGVTAGTDSLKCTYLGYQGKSFSLASISEDIVMDLILTGSMYDMDQIEIKANHLNDDAAFTYQNVDEDAIKTTNLGQDIPQLLQFTPSAVATSDAGAGIGYTGIRIRGSDPTRINVTINGIPLNDSESQGVFWVNLPDLASSTKNIQIQRGLGSSTAGAGAFGASIGINTNQFHQNAYASLNSTYGSFNTRKLNFQLGTGLMNDVASIDFKYALIQSDGYIDRGSSDLKSWSLSAAKLHKNGSLRLNILSGDEVTYQSWYGSPQSKVEGDDEALLNHYYNNLGSIYQNEQDSINLFDSDRSYNYYLYENQVDDYNQDHYQLHLSQKMGLKTIFNGSIHYTKGKGYFEEFRYKDDLANYGFPDFVTETDDTLSVANIIRRRALDNDFYGAITNFSIDLNEDLNLKLGAGFNNYIGDHFGTVFDHEYVQNINTRKTYYENQGKKSELNGFAKMEYAITNAITSFVDLQYRAIDYSTEGTDNDGVNFDISDNLNFINPKLGLSYQLSPSNNIYASIGIGNREPDRNDYVDFRAEGNPKHESMTDIELGYRMNKESLKLEAVVYNMIYKDQLVLTGELNDVGSTLRTNVDDSYRRGIELSASLKRNKLTWSPNFTFSQNKIKRFDEIVYCYCNEFEIITNNFENTDISFSPSMIAGQRLAYAVNKQFQVEWLSKYVGKQFLDNTSNDDRSLDAYWVNDLRLAYQFDLRGLKNIGLNFLINNIVDTKYSSNGYSYNYQLDSGLITENFLYPQAGRNFLLALNIDF